jgi:hypothetical protein
MMRKTKRFTITLSAALAAILILFLSTCVPFGPPDDYEDFVLPEFTDVEYSPDGGSITIYLDGSAPVRNSRALNLKWAKVGFDFFEVAFFHPVSGVIARAVWETGHAAGVNGVYRGVNGGGIDYRHAYAPGSPPSLPAGEGAAILFVGKRSDKTLLALGSLTHVNNGAGTGSGTTVTADTRSVTFSVAAIDVGVRYKRDIIDPSTPESSFLTAANGTPNYTTPNETNTTTRRIRIGWQHFPAFRFAAVDRNVEATYRFKVYDPEGIVTIDTFIGGILQAGPATFATFSTTPPPLPPPPSPADYNLDPRYPLGGGDWESTLWPPMLKDNSTGVTFRNNWATNNDNPFQNPVEFRFATLASQNGKVFAFSFQIPVYSLINAGNPGTWYLRPGYDSYLYDLDDGEGGTGGAILIGTGEFEDSNPYLWIKPPDKAMYPGSPSSYAFDWYGIQAELRIGNDDEYSILKPIITIPPLESNDPSLHFYVKNINTGVETPIGRDTDLQPYFLQGGVGPGANPDYVINGMLNIIVRYNDSGVIHPAELTLFLYTGGTGTPSEDMIDGRFIIATQNEFNLYMPIVSANPGNYLFVFFDNFTFSSTVVLQGGPYYIIIIAARPGVTIGNNAFDVSNTNANGSTFYLGKWPFNDTLSVQGLAINSEPLTVTNGGSGSFINRGAGVTINIDEGPGFTVIGNLVN